LQTPHVPPSFAQRLQYLQFLHARQGESPRQVAAYSSAGAAVKSSVAMRAAISFGFMSTE